MSGITNPLLGCGTLSAGAGMSLGPAGDVLGPAGEAVAWVTVGTAGVYLGTVLLLGAFLSFRSAARRLRRTGPGSDPAMAMLGGSS